MKLLQPLRILALLALTTALVSTAATATPAAGNYGSQKSHVSIGGHIGIGIGHGKKPHIGHYPSPYHAPRRLWVAGCWVTESQRVWIPGQYTQVWIDPVYATKCDYLGNTIQVLVSPGHFDTVQQPGYWSSKRVRVWQPGHWA